MTRLLLMFVVNILDSLVIIVSDFSV